MITKLTFEDDLYDLLLEKKYETILEFVKNPENEKLIKSKVWNLINKVCLTLKTNKILEHESDFVLCNKILLHIIEHGSPKEVIVALMEEADSFKEHSFFCLLLDPLKETLKKVPSKRGKSLEWVLNTLNAHIELLPPPKFYELQDEEKLLLDATSEVMDANYILKNYYNFIAFFVDEVSFKKLQNKEKDSSNNKVEYQQEILQKYILKLFHHPFLYHDLHIENLEKPKSSIQVLCEKYMMNLSKICRNVFGLFNYYRPDVKRRHQIDEEDYEESVSLLSFGGLSYLIFVEKLALDFEPFIYSHRYIFINQLKFILPLLSDSNNFVLYKGLLLAQVLLGNLEDLEISYSYVEIDMYAEFSRLLLSVAIHSQIKEYRQLSVKNFLAYINKCDWKARYHLIMQVVCTTNHSGCVGLAISLYRNYLHDNLNNKDSTCYFLGKNLILFLKKVLVLPEGAETDLLENNDQIISTLNLIRYLLLKDKKTENVTGVWNLTSDINKSFLQPLENAIDLSRAHYKEAAKEAEEGRKTGKEKDIVTVNNTALPNVAWKDVYQKALVTFDMQESILSRCREIIN